MSVGSVSRALPDTEHTRLLRDVIVPLLTSGATRVFCSDTAGATPAGLSLRAPPGYVLRRHVHEDYEVCWVVEGPCLLWLGNHLLALEPRTACIVRPGEAHQLRPSPQRHHFRTLWWRATPRGVAMFEGVFAGQRHASTTSFVSLDTPVAALLDRVVRELQIRRPFFELLARTTLLELAARILRALAEGTGGDLPVLEAASGRKRENWSVQRLMEYIQTHHGAEVSLPRLAAAVGLAPGYLTTLFRQHTGLTVMAYVRDVRHREALALLRNTDLPVAAVARLVGYEDPAYLSRLFRAREGCSPYQYRCLFRAPPGASAE